MNMVVTTLRRLADNPGMRRAATAMWMVLMGASGCTKHNPTYCDTAMDCPNGQFCDLETHGCTPNPVDANTSCSMNSDCDPQTPICDNSACRACALDDECESRVCRADGACESLSNVLYVAPNGISAGMCPFDAPCELTYARSLLTSERSTIRLSDGTYSLASVFTISPPISTVTIVGGAGAVVQRTGTGPSFDVRGGASMTLRGFSLQRGIECNIGSLTVNRVSFASSTETRSWMFLNMCTATVASSQLQGSTSYGIEATASGSLSIDDTRIAQSAAAGIKADIGQLAITHSTVRENAGIGVLANCQQTTIHSSIIAANKLGGVSSVGGVFDVTNNFVYRNGDDTNATFGGLRLDTNDPGNRVAHNTIVRNEARYETSPPYSGGMFCRGGGTAANNLITNNFLGNADHPSAQIAGTCTLTGNSITPDALPMHFLKDDFEPFDYHLADAQSAAVNKGMVLNPPISDDFDGDARSDGQPDVGADEL